MASVISQQSWSNLLIFHSHGKFIFLSQETPAVPDIGIFTIWLRNYHGIEPNNKSEMILGGSFYQVFTGTTAAPATPALAKARSINRFVFYGVSRRVN